MSKLTQMPENYSEKIKWISKSYEDAGIRFSEGFQKDAIQNALGARDKTLHWENWSCRIYVEENSKGTFVVIEDEGTVGLTGENLCSDIINNKMKNCESLPAEERLARFSSMFNSGNNDTGGGLYGVGKIVYIAASENNQYYFDSLRNDGKYVANMNNCFQSYSVAKENDEAKVFIKEHTGLDEKKTVGTRIIIVKPKKELIDDIISKKIIKYIQETWWLTIKKLKHNSHIYVQGEQVVLPNEIFEAKNCIHDIEKPDKYNENYTVKHFGFYISENSTWHKFSYYRKGMKIGDIEINDIPKELEGKYWGYIEVDKKWEEELADIEDNIHFGVSRGKRNTKQYRNLKNYCDQKVKALLEEWGYIKNKEIENKKLNDMMSQIAGELQNHFEKLGFDDLGKGPKKPNIDVRWQNIKYPIDRSEKVTSGDSIEFSVRIKSTYTTDKKFTYSLYVLDPQTDKKLSDIQKKDTITINSNSPYTRNFIHKIDNKNSKQGAENRIILEVKCNGNSKSIKKELQYFYDIDRPKNSRDTVKLVLHQCKFPRENSRRVNFDESVTDISYLIENKRNINLNYKINISIHNATSPSKDKIADVGSFTGKIPPFEEIITKKIDKITFDKSLYEQHLNTGILELRARLIANEDDDIYRKGDKITHYNYKIYLNCDEKNGKNNSFIPKSIKAPDNFKRSWCEAGNNRTIYINIGHIAYSRYSDYPDFQHEYIKEEMLKQYILLYLKEGMFDTFKVDDSFTNLEPQEAVETVIEKIEDVYFQSLR